MLAVSTSELQQLALCFKKQACKLFMAPRTCRRSDKVTQRDGKMEVSGFCFLFESWKMQEKKIFMVQG